MEKLRRISLAGKTAFLWGVVMLSLTSCVEEILDDCYNETELRVVVKAYDGSTFPGGIDDVDFETVTLYVFNADDVLLDVISTNIGEIVPLKYPITEKLRIAATANIDARMNMADLIPGVTTRSQLAVWLKNTDDQNPDDFRQPADMFFGVIEFDNSTPQGTLELPIERKVAAVTVRIKGLKEYIGNRTVTDADIKIVFGTLYNQLNFHGEPGRRAGRAGFTVNYTLYGGFRTLDMNDYFEVPAYTGGDVTDYFRIISSREGSAVSVSIYYNGQLVTDAPITRDTDGDPITVTNDRLNIINIALESSSIGQITVSVREAAWNGYVEIEKDFFGS